MTGFLARKSNRSATTDTSPAGSFRQDDMGFSTRVGATKGRFVNKDGGLNIIRAGVNKFHTLHIYQWLVLMKWRHFMWILFSFYTVANSAFAMLYVWVGMDGLSGSTPGNFSHNFLQAFFFSAQTLTTVGYGGMHPVTTAANIVSSFEALVGLMIFAVITGLLFARFSKPSAKLVFSDNALISPYGTDGGKALMLRLSNRRKINLLELEGAVVATWLEPLPSGDKTRLFRSLKLERNTVPMLPLSWTLVHPINEESPFADWTPEDFKVRDTEFMISITGFDDTFGQTVRANTSYKWDEMVWGAKFDLMYYPDEEGALVLDLAKINDHTLVDLK